MWYPICNLLDRNTTSTSLVESYPFFTSRMVCGKLQVRPCPTSSLDGAHVNRWRRDDRASCIAIILFILQAGVLRTRTPDKTVRSQLQECGGDRIMVSCWWSDNKTVNRPFRKTAIAYETEVSPPFRVWVALQDRGIMSSGIRGYTNDDVSCRYIVKQFHPIFSIS